MRQRILVVDDDPSLAEMLTIVLRGEGFDTAVIGDGTQALTAVRELRPDLVLLDLMLPGMNGLEILRELRQSCQTPLLMLSARGEPVDRILGLELGADDYLAKPCDPRELVARLRALLRRSQPSADTGNEELSHGNLRLDTGNLMAWQDDEPLQLTQSEALILRALMARPGQVVDRQTLSREALGKPLGSYDRSLDMHISNLRRKLGPHPEGRQRIQSIRGRGYLLGH